MTRALNLLVILSMFVVSLVYLSLSISVNSGRIAHLQRQEAVIQTIVTQIARDTDAPDIKELKAQLVTANGERESLLSQIEYGNNKFWPLDWSTCLLPTSAGCFHKNASETNNLYLAMACGVVGASLFLLLQIYLGAQPNRDPLQQSSLGLAAVISFLPIGVAVALAALFLLRGTKGALLAPVANVVQLETRTA